MLRSERKNDFGKQQPYDGDHAIETNDPQLSYQEFRWGLGFEKAQEQLNL